MKTADANRLNKLIRKAGSVLGLELYSGGGGGEEDVEESTQYYGQCLLPLACHTRRIRAPSAETTEEGHRRYFLPWPSSCITPTPSARTY